MAKKNFENFTREEIIEKIRSKKEFSEIPVKDIELVYSEIEKKGYIVVDSIKETRDLLRKMYTAFVSDKILTKKEKKADFILSRHISTKERMGEFSKVYSESLGGFSKKDVINVIDFGCGVNGFSYSEFAKLGFNVNYVGVEPVGQLVDSQNNYFKKNNMNAKSIKLSLFDLEENVRLVESLDGVRVAFFFKVLDSLEMLKKDYSKEVLLEIIPRVDRVVISWATKSLVSKRVFAASRKWLTDFLSKDFIIESEFETEFEKYIVVRKK